MKALIVDDSKMLRLHLGKMMRAMGWCTSEAENGAHALEVLRGDDEFVLALMDVNMPVMNGIECVRRLRAEFGHKAKIMMVTTEADLHLIAGVLEDGADEFLMKPFTPENLRAKLQILSLSPVA
jgi:two-component system chemotaxis response regulator CheY